MFRYTEALRRAWPVFVEAARTGRTVSYSELAGRAGPPLQQRQVHRQLLQPLGARCRDSGLPDLSALVVRKDTGLPGGGWYDPTRPAEPMATWAEALAACFAYPWPREPDPRLLAHDNRQACEPGARPKPSGHRRHAAQRAKSKTRGQLPPK